MGGVELYLCVGRADLIVRQAVISEAHEHYDMLVESFWKEQSFHGLKFPVNPEKVDAYIRAYIENGVVLSAYDDGLVGSFAIKVQGMWWSDVPVAKDGWFYVRKEGRPKASLALLEAVKDRFKDMPLFVGVFNTDDQDRKDKFFTRKGFRRVGGWYVNQGDK